MLLPSFDLIQGEGEWFRVGICRGPKSLGARVPIDDGGRGRGLGIAFDGDGEGLVAGADFDPPRACFD
jgi:hypothetical protein